jgi:tRNA pseudouridine13 synthase
MDYKIKELPEDFVVKEIPDKTFNKVNGKYLIYKLIKKNRNTEDCIQFIAKKLKLPRKFFGFAGTKDKHAITEQYISIFNIQNIKNKILEIKDFENFSLEFFGFLDNPLSLGDLKGNYFEITIRNISQEISIINPKFIVNYFDEQRFSELNKEIGKAIIKKDFNNAVQLLKQQNQVNDELLKTFNNDPIKILRHIPKKTLNLFIHAYQSFLFNEVCKEIIKQQNINHKEADYCLGKLFFLINDYKNFKIPLIGFGSEINSHQEIIFSILAKEKITQRDFIIKSIPELSSFGAERDFIARVDNFNYSFDKENKLLKLMFELQKGAYATIVLKKIFCFC